MLLTGIRNHNRGGRDGCNRPPHTSRKPECKRFLPEKLKVAGLDKKFCAIMEPDASLQRNEDS
jgi:hypothetical protein